MPADADEVDGLLAQMRAVGSRPGAERVEVYQSVREYCAVCTFVGSELLDGKDYVEAEGWLTEGVRRTLRKDDERLLHQLTEMRAMCLAGLGRGSDDLQVRAEQAVAAQDRHDTQRVKADAVATSSPAERMGAAWVPAAHYERARRLWPEMSVATSSAVDEHGAPRTHTDYCRSLDRTLASVARRLRDSSPRQTLHIVPLRVDAFLRWCADTGRDAGDADARATWVRNAPSSADRTCGTGRRAPSRTAGAARASGTSDAAARTGRRS